MRFHDTAMFDRILENVCLGYIEDTEDIEIAETKSMEFALDRLAKAFGKAMSEFNAGLRESAPRPWRVKENVVRRPLCEFGRIEYEKTVYIDEAGERRHLVDEVVGMPERSRMTPNFARMLAENATSTSYAAAADLISRHCRVSVSETAIASLIAETGAVLKAASERKAYDLFELGLAPGGRAGSGELYAEADGVWVSAVKRGYAGGPRKIEIKDFVAYTGKEDGELRNRVVHAGADLPAAFWKDAVAEAADVIDISNLGKVRLGCDGGSWCKGGAAYLPGDVEVNLDAWHINRSINLALEDRAEARTAVGIVYGCGAGALSAWLALRHPDNEKAQRLKRYIDNNIDIIDMSKNLGSIEGINAHAISDRMEAWGCAWSRKGADAMARCRSARMNGKRLQVRQRSSWFGPGREERVAAAIGRKKVYHGESIGKGYGYPHQAETKRMPARQKYLLTRCGSKSMPY